MRESIVERLDQDPHHAAKRGTDGHGGHKDTRGHLASVRDDDERRTQHRGEQQRVDHTPLCPALAKVIVVAAALALAEEDLERLGHIDAQELIGVPNEGREHRQHHHLAHAVLGKVVASKRLHLQIVLDDKRAIQPAKDADDHVEDDLKVVPVAVVRNLEEHELARTEGVHERQRHRRRQRAQERAPHGRRRKLYAISSSEKSTPPIGEPNATATPAADAAVSSSRILAWLRLNERKKLATTLPMQHATCTAGLPCPRSARTQSPAAT